VNGVLAEIGADDVPQILVYNKIDLTEQTPRSERDASGRVAKVWLSATTGAGVDLLIEVLAEHYRRRRRTLVLELPPSAGRLRALVYERFDVAREAPLASGGSLLELMLDDAQLAWLNEQRDFRPEYVVSDARLVLAPAGSLS